MNPTTGQDMDTHTTGSKPKILIVDDQPENIRLLGSLLKENYTPMAATSGEKALEHAISDHRPDLILLDIVMPVMDGHEVCRRLKADKRTQDIPVIFISALGEVEDEAKGLELGAVDYIAKPFNSMIVESRVRTHLELKHHHDHLEDLVNKRTQDLNESNKQLGLTLHELEKEILHRVNAESTLRSNESKLTSIISAFRGFIYTSDKDSYRIDFMNQALIDKAGHDGTGDLCFKAIFGFEEPCPWCAIERVRNGKTVETEIEHPKNERWFYAILSPVFDRDGSVAKNQTILIDITKRKLAERELQEKEQYLRKENILLRASMKDRYRCGNIIGKSKPMQGVYETILRAASTDVCVIIYGDSGTGKELVAQAIHEQSDRGDKKLVIVNCGAIPKGIAESEFFGHRKGAFTGADSDKAGFLDIADHGSLFLDEIGDLSLDLQVKLLRAIEGGGYSPVGSRDVKKPDFRIIAATSKDLKSQVKNGLMRDDFYYRIHIIPINLPPLRKRKEDIPLLIDHLLDKYDPEERPQIDGKILDAFMNYDWPGNVRELQNTLHRYLTLNKIDFIGLDLSESDHDKKLVTIGDNSEKQTLRDILGEVERTHIVDALVLNKWRKGKTAESLGIDPKTLLRKINQYHITKPD